MLRQLVPSLIGLTTAAPQTGCFEQSFDSHSASDPYVRPSTRERPTAPGQRAAMPSVTTRRPTPTSMTKAGPPPRSTTPAHPPSG